MLPGDGERVGTEFLVQLIDHDAELAVGEERGGERRNRDTRHCSFGLVKVVSRSGPGQLLHYPGCGQRRIDAGQQVTLILRLGGHRQGDRHLVGILEQVGDLGQQQAGRAVDRAAAAGERAVSEPAAGVGEHHALGAAFDGEPGQPGQVLGDAGLPERLGDLGLDLRVVDDRVLEQRAGGALRRGLALRRPLGADERAVQQPGRAGQVLDRAGGAEQRGADVMVDVVERVAALGVGRPGFQRPVGQAQRAAVGQPVEDVNDRGLVRGDRRVEAEAVDRVRRRGEAPHQVGQADLHPGPLERGEHQAQVGQPATVERPAGASREDRRLGGVERVEAADEPDLAGRRDQRVAEQFAEVGGHLVGPAQHLLESPGPRPGRGDHVVGEHQPDRVLVGAEVAELARSRRLSAAHGRHRLPRGFEPELETGQVQDTVLRLYGTARFARDQAHGEHVVAAGSRRPGARPPPCGPRWRG